MNNILKSVFAAMLIMGAMLFGASTSHAGSSAQPTLVELFTSQGCSSCPPADAYLIELDKREDLIAISMHITYWDYIGWKDPFATAAITERQRAYGRRIGRGRIYTPEIIVNGMRDAVGSQRSAVNRVIAQIQEEAPSDLDISVTVDADQTLQISIPDGSINGSATVWLARFDKEHVTEIERGENGGRTLRNINVVREIREIGTWNGEPLKIELPMSSLIAADGAGNDGGVIIVQQDGFGQVLAVRRVMFADQS